MELLGEIFSQKVTRWRDKRILAENPELADIIPDQKITIVVRAGSSGTTSVFSSSLSLYSESWNKTFGSFR